MDIGVIGVWDQRLRYGDEPWVADSAAEIEELGYGAVWLPDIGGDIFRSLDVVLSATQRIAVATGILNLWFHTPQETAEGRQRLITGTGRHPLLGIGVSHAPLIESLLPGTFRTPLATTRRYLDDLDRAEPPVPAEERLLAALRPRMLELARERTRGAMAYHQPPEHTAGARGILGPGTLLVTEQCIVVERDPSTARDAAREHLAFYLALPSYVDAWRSLGFDDEDLSGGGSDRFIDAVVVWGDDETIRRRIQLHRDAGADHVCVQVISGDDKVREGWRALAPVLLSD